MLRFYNKDWPVGFDLEKTNFQDSRKMALASLMGYNGPRMESPRIHERNRLFERVSLIMVQAKMARVHKLNLSKDSASFVEDYHLLRIFRTLVQF